MRGHKTNPPYAFNLFNLLQKLRKGNLLIQIFPIRVDILSKQHNLCNAVLRQTPDFVQNILYLTAAFPAAYIGNNTIAAEIIAAKHNIGAGLKGILTFNRQILYNPVRILPDIYYHALFFCKRVV